MPAPSWLRNLSTAANKNSPTILSTVAVAGVISTAILASRASVQAAKVLNENDAEHDWKQTPKEAARLCWRLYVPAIASGATTIFCIISANKVSLQRNAALVSAYALAETTFREYKDEVIRQIGNTKEQKVADEVSKRKIESNPSSDAQVIITGRGDQLCYDTFTGRYFRSDIETLRKAQNDFNRDMLGGMAYGSLNEFYANLGLGPTVAGNELGFNLDVHVELIFSSHLADDGTPCLAVAFARLPNADYTRV